MPLMGSIYVGTSGLQSSQNALNTTAHNLSNADTTGFVRQQVLYGDRVYNTIKKASVSVNQQQVGLGVTYEKVRQVRDYFLDQSFRRENGRNAFYATSYATINEIEDLLNELNDDASFNKAMTDMWSSIEELAKTPDDTVVQRLLIQNASSFLTSAKQVYQGIADYQNELNNSIKDGVDRINELGRTIKQLNDRIRAVEVGGIEAANDLRDARNQALDELASFVNISYSEDIYSTVTVKVEGVNFVCSDFVYEMALERNDTTGFYEPYWPQEATYKKMPNGLTEYDTTFAKVFDLSQIISSEKNTDIGKLRSMLYARGDKLADFTDIPVKPETPKISDYAGATDPAYISAVEDYEIKMNEYDKKVAYYNKTVAQSVCMNIMAEFDQLVHNVVTAVNGVLKDAYDRAGKGTYMTDDDGSPLEIFKRVESEGYTYNKSTGEWEHVEENIDDDYFSDTLYSIPNLIINPTLVREAGKMGFVLADGTVDYVTANALVAAFDADIYSLNPNVTTKCSLNTYYSNLVSQVANSGSVYQSISISQQATVDSITYSREQIQGVSSDEELNNMIKYQNAFNASSRYINVVNEMLEHIINQLG